jgi:predicted nucleic acid-binding protein
MILLVNDANILIDLLQIDLLSAFFRLPCEFHATDLVLAEILETNTADLNSYINGGTLKIKHFSFPELMEIQSLNFRHKNLSIPDCSCLFLSKALSARLLTGEAAMRRIAAGSDIKVHGVLWIFDQLVGQKIITETQAHKKLSRLMFLNARLPVSECKKRLNLWK